MMEMLAEDPEVAESFRGALLFQALKKSPTSILPTSGLQRTGKGQHPGIVPLAPMGDISLFVVRALYISFFVQYKVKAMVQRIIFHEGPSAFLQI
jgi:hypothetical protein